MFTTSVMSTQRYIDTLNVEIPKIHNLVNSHPTYSDNGQEKEKHKKILDTTLNSIDILTVSRDREYFPMERDYFTKYISWSIPSRDALEKIKEFVKNDIVIEVAAGSGIWSVLMTAIGITVFPTDIQEKSGQILGNFIVKKIGSFTENQEFFPYCNVLFISWPSLYESWATETLKQFKGNKFVYIGEERGGCCADDSFFDELDENWEWIECHNIPMWRGLHDCMSFYQRKQPIENPSLKLRKVFEDLDFSFLGRNTIMQSVRQLFLNFCDGDYLETRKFKYFAPIGYINNILEKIEWLKMKLIRFQDKNKEEIKQREEETFERDTKNALSVSLRNTDEWTEVKNKRKK